MYWPHLSYISSINRVNSPHPRLYFSTEHSPQGTETINILQYAKLTNGVTGFQSEENFPTPLVVSAVPTGGNIETLDRLKWYAMRTI